MIPHRQCVGCKKVLPKKELLRFVSLGSNTIAFDKKGRLSGRGAYLCPDRSCLERAIRDKRLQRALGVSSLGKNFVTHVVWRLKDETLESLHLCYKIGYLKIGFDEVKYLKEGDVVVLSGGIIEEITEPIVEKAKTLSVEVYQVPFPEYCNVCLVVLIRGGYPKKNNILKTLQVFSRLTSGGDNP